MTISSHPDDELLAALAGADPDATADGGLRAHVADCPRCRELVNDLSTLRTALAAMPDPPVPPGFRAWTARAAPARAPARPQTGERFRETLRRMFAPAMLAGASLAVIGAVGVSGLVGGTLPGSAGAGGAAPLAAQERAADTSGQTVTESAGGGDGAGAEEGAAASPGASVPSILLAPADEDGDTTAFEDAGAPAGDPTGDDRRGWILVLAAGAVLFAGALIGRRLLEPSTA